MVKKITIVEDELFMREELQYIVEKEGYETYCATDFSNIVEDIIESSPDLILLDLNLPGISGFEICKAIRYKSNVPVLVLTGRNQMKDELQALEIGADDYINKPCHKERLLARISNLLRRSEDKSNSSKTKSINFDSQTYTINFKGKAMVLPDNQGKIMELLFENYEKLVTKEMLFKKLWGTTEFIDENTLNVNMTRLKKNLKNLTSEYSITTIRGKGYLLKGVGEGTD